MRRFSTEKYFKNPVIRRYSRIAAFAVFGLVIGITFASVVQKYISPQAPQLDMIHEQDVIQVLSLEHSGPLRMRIPSIGVDAGFEAPLGVDANYEIEVPESYDTVGWYKYGPTPGEMGPAVVLGHVYSYEGPALLFAL